MKVTLENIGRRYNNEWIFRNINTTIDASKPTVIIGANGSGKSTLLKLIAGSISPSEGKVRYNYPASNTHIDVDDIFRHLGFASPYLELVEEFTLCELIEYSARMKPFKKGISKKDVLEISGLSHSGNKEIRNFSSGMKQRVKLSLAILSDTPLLLLDEPVSNLDKAAIIWYQKIVSENKNDRTVIVCSNNTPEEHFFCTEKLIMEDFK